MKKIMVSCALSSFFLALLLSGCGGGNSANAQLIGGECLSEVDCDDENDDTPPLECLLDFKGGLCGRADCAADADCPKGSICATVDTVNYCLLVCTQKSQCNVNRAEENESNCSSNVDPVEGGTDKVCVPPAAS